jgi:putative FmdB family regulatory protein
MPFYEYKCVKCGHVFDALLTISGREKEEKRLTCPECGAGRPERQISTFATSSSTSFNGLRPAGCPLPPKHSCSSGG